MVRKNNNAVHSVGEIFNLAQRSRALHKKCLAMMQEAFAIDPESVLLDFVERLKHIMVSSKKDAIIERVMRFAVDFVIARAKEEETAMEDGQFHVEVLSFLVKNLVAKDRGVRLRAAELATDIMEGLPETFQLDEDLADEYKDAMAQRLRDKGPMVRATAARGIVRLMDCGDDGSYSDCDVMTIMMSMLGSDTSKDVRLSIVSYVPVCERSLGPIILRSRDVCDAVRAEVYSALAKVTRVPVLTLTIQQRAEVIRRGLADRSRNVVEAAQEMLAGWLTEQCNSNLADLLGLLDVELHEDEAMEAVRALIASKKVDPSALAKQAKETEAGLRQSASDALLTPEEALLWRAVCEHLCAEQARLSRGAAVGTGYPAALDAAAATKLEDALEDALPPSVEAFVELLAAHCDAGAAHRCAARQLLLTAARCQDFTDAAGRAAASELVTRLLGEAPKAGDEHSCGASVGFGGDGLWEEAVVEFAVKVLGTGDGLAQAVCQAAAACLQSWGGTEEAGVQLLAIVASVVRRMTSSRGLAECDVQGMTPGLLVEQAVITNTGNPDARVRQRATAALGAFLLLDGAPGCPKEYAGLLRLLLVQDSSPAVTAEAAKALADLCLVRSPGHVDAASRDFFAPDGAGAHLVAGLPALAEKVRHGSTVAMLGEALVDAMDSLRTAWDATTRKTTRAQLEAPDACAEGPASVVDACAQGLARIAAHNQVFESAAGAQGALSKQDLTLTIARVASVAVDPAAPEVVQQMLLPFLQAVAQSSAANHAAVASAVIPACRLAFSRAQARRSCAPTLAKMMAAVLTLPVSGVSDPASAPLGHEELCERVCLEILRCPRDAMTKVYMAALCKILSTVPVSAVSPESAPGSIVRLRQLAEYLSHRIADKTAVKDAAAFAQRLAQLDSDRGEALPELEIATLQAAIRIYEDGDDTIDLPFDSEAPTMMDEMERPRRGGRAPAGRAKARRGRAASVSSEEDAEEGEESDLGPESDGEVSDADAGAPEGMNVECENALEEDADMAASDDGDGDGRGVEEELEQENMEEVVSEPRGKRARVTGRAGSGRRALRERS